ncbi:MAG TPA: glycosyltransferase family 2 protein [Candidatus Methylacidiphilales bacterium]|nr:glycosyltransferase family 2 protein [Candidatus Methylacidiphilales bacterium]
MKKTFPVTVVVPTFRRLTFLAEALASALNQTFRDFELIVTDDGNSPEIARIAASFADPRIRYRANSRPLGIAMNHYAAFLEARGTCLANLHDDDVWEPDFLAELLPPLESDPSVAVAFCDHHLIDERGRFLPERTRRNTRIYRRDYLAAGRHQPFLKMAVIHESIPVSMGAVFRKSILDRADYPPRIGGSYDHWLAYLAARNGQAAYYVPRRLTRYRLHTESGTIVRGIKNYKDNIYLRSRFLKQPDLAPWRQSLSNSLGVTYGKLALFFLEQKRFHRAWIMEKRAFSLMNRPKNFLGLLMNTVLGVCRMVRR